MHEIRIELPSYQPVDTQVVASHWSGGGTAKKASITVPLKPFEKDKRGKRIDIKLPPTPPKPPDATGFANGEGVLHVESTPQGAEVWLYIGVTGSVSFPVVAGRAYEMRVLKDGYLPGYASVTPDEWREKGGDQNTPIDIARKKESIEKSLELVPDPGAGSGAKKGK
jgi:hypothetical protein